MPTNNNNGNSNPSAKTTTTPATINTGNWYTAAVPTNQISFDFMTVDWDSIRGDRTYITYDPQPQKKVKVGNEEGYICKCCDEFFPMAEINMPDKTFQCYSCTNGLATVFK